MRRECEVYSFLKAKDGERCQATIGLNKQTYIFDNNLAVDELEAVEM